ncbi:uncharacterized protein LOC144709652 [Wolffia australiana]
MKLQTQAMELGYSALTARTKSCSVRGSSHYSAAFQQVRDSNKIAYLRGKDYTLPNQKLFKVLSFKSNGHEDESTESDRASIASSRNPREELFTTAPDLASGKKVVDQPTKNLLLKLPIIRDSHTLKVSADEDRAESLRKVSDGDKYEIGLKAAFLCFLRLNVTIKLPLLIFVPWYFCTRVIYGLEVTNELTPLWVLGPVITAIYVKLIQGIFFLYVFSLKLVIRVLQNVPSYSVSAYNFIMERRIQAFLYACLCQPIVDVINADYHALGQQKLKQIKHWVVESYLDYVESVWPYYCRTIRFLKRANLL